MENLANNKGALIYCTRKDKGNGWRLMKELLYMHSGTGNGYQKLTIT
jgi:hypothetical protein